MSKERIMCYDHKVNPEEVPTYWMKEYCPTCLRAEVAALRSRLNRISKKISDTDMLEFIMGVTVLTAIGHRYLYGNGPFTRWQATLNAESAENVLTRKVIAAAMRDARRVGKINVTTRCDAVIFCGPGHQSTARCDMTGPHDQHNAGEYWWTKKKAYSGFFDESPQEEGEYKIRAAKGRKKR